MPSITPLPTTGCTPRLIRPAFPGRTAGPIPLPRNGNSRKNPFQPRAMQALDLALQIRTAGYNIYLSGEADLGRSYMLLSYLRPQARKAPTPPDLVYVQNFADPDRPSLLALPAGQGKKFKQTLKETLENVGKELARRFEATTYVKQRAKAGGPVPERAHRSAAQDELGGRA